MSKSDEVIAALRSTIDRVLSDTRLANGFPYFDRCPFGNLETRLAVVFLQPYVHAFGMEGAVEDCPDETEVTSELRTGMLEVCEQARSSFPSYDEIVEETQEICGSRIRSLCAMPDEEYGNVMHRLDSMNIQMGIDDNALRILHSYAFDCFFAFLTVVGRRHESGNEMEDAAWVLNEAFDGFYLAARAVILGDGEPLAACSYDTVEDVVKELRLLLETAAETLFDDKLTPRFSDMQLRGTRRQLVALIGYWGCLYGSGRFMTSVGVLRYMELCRGVALGPRVEEFFAKAMGPTLKSFSSDLITRNAPRVPDDPVARKCLSAEEILEMLLGPGSGDGRKYVFDDICAYLDYCFSEYARLADVEKRVTCAKEVPVVIDARNGIKASELFLRGLDEWNRKDYTASLKTLECAAKFGHMMAASIAADAYRKGDNVKVDRLAAAALYERNAKRGDEAAMLQVALFDVRGKEMPPNYEQAIEMASALAEKNNVEAMHCMGLAHLRLAIAGRHEHLRDAFCWLERASKKEFKKIHFGWTDNDVHYDSWGKDPDETPEADAARADATFLLGLMYEKGLWMKAEREKARELYELAIRRGSEPARQALEKLNRGSQQIEVSWEGYFDFLWRSSEDFIKGVLFCQFPEVKAYVGVGGAAITLTIASHLAVTVQRDELIGADDVYDRYGEAPGDADYAVEDGVLQVIPDSLPDDLYSRITEELRASIKPELLKFMLDMYGDTPELRATAKITQIGQAVCQSLLRNRGVGMMELGSLSSSMNGHFARCFKLYKDFLERLS